MKKKLVWSSTIFIIALVVNFFAIRYISTDHYLKYKYVSKVQKIAYIVNPKYPKISDRPATDKTLDGVSVRCYVNGKIKSAYLYIDVLVDYKIPLTKYDAISINFTDEHRQRFGEKIITEANRILTPLEKGNIYIYDLKRISFKKLYYGNSKKDTDFFYDQDILNVLNNNRYTDIYTFVSSARPGRVINEISIRYECETKDCYIEVGKQ